MNSCGKIQGVHKFHDGHVLQNRPGRSNRKQRARGLWTSRRPRGSKDPPHSLQWRPRGGRVPPLRAWTLHMANFEVGIASRASPSQTIPLWPPWFFSLQISIHHPQWIKEYVIRQEPPRLHTRWQNHRIRHHTDTLNLVFLLDNSQLPPHSIFWGWRTTTRELTLKYGRSDREGFLDVRLTSGLWKSSQRERERENKAGLCGLWKFLSMLQRRATTCEHQTYKQTLGHTNSLHNT